MNSTIATSQLDAHDATTRSRVDRLVALATAGLPRMIDPATGLFCHSRVMDDDGSMRRIGTSVRYTATVLLGAAQLPDAALRSALGGVESRQRADAMVACIRATGSGISTGDLALATWALVELAHPAAHDHLPQLAARLAVRGPGSTVDAAWALLAFQAARRCGAATRLEDVIAPLRRQLLEGQSASGLFPPHAAPRGRDALRRHVACFADQVYPILALAHLAAEGDEDALAAATRCAETITRCQGADGQWWWHYDVRHGTVVEEYPVYAVHQDSMGPMALLALERAGGPAFRSAVERSLAWLHAAPEVERSLVDEPRGVVWRKVDRTDRLKAVRTVRAASTRLDPHWRLPWIDAIARPERLDHECRPYHLGWILYCWARPGAEALPCDRC